MILNSPSKIAAHLENLLQEQRLLKEDFEELTDSEKKRLKYIEEEIQDIENYYDC